MPEFHATLRFRANTATGDRFDIDFPLHADTVSRRRTGRLVEDLLAAVTRETARAPDLANGDVLQALAMTLAIRAAMIPAPHEVTGGIARGLLEDALAAAFDARRAQAPHGHG